MPKHPGEKFILTASHKLQGKKTKNSQEMRNHAGGKKEKPVSKGKPGAFKSPNASKGSSLCPYDTKCGGCQLLDLSYEEQLKLKQKNIEALLKKFGSIRPIIGMDNPFHYRNKVHAVMDFDRRGNVLSGIYEAGSHRVVPIEKCLIEDEKANQIIATIRKLAKSFKYKIYAEDSGHGLLRHILVKRGFSTGEIMVVLVLSSPILPSKNNFTKALLAEHPEITTVILNINNRKTSMVLGDKESVIYGKGYIEDLLCGCRFRISAKSFYQVNPVQTEKLYNKAISLAALTGKETVLDTYSGIGTIGLIASRDAKEVIGVESNADAVKDGAANAKLNQIKNVRFFKSDAGEFMMDYAKEKMNVDVVFMDPPRAGSDENFLSALVKMAPAKIVYISCNPVTLERDLQYLVKHKYIVREIQPVDMFPMTEHVETIVLLQRENS